MRRSWAEVLVLVAALALAGCVLTGKSKSKAATTPAAPKPASNAAPPQAAPQPLSVPQTEVELPPPQPIDPEALATAPPERPAEPPSPTRPARPRPSPPQTPAPKPEAQTQTQPGPPPAATPPQEEERAPVQAMLTAEEQQKLKDSAQTRRREAAQALAQAQQGRRLSAHERDLVKRTQSFLNQSEQAENRGDLRQADSLAERAQVLARELQGGR